MFVDQLDQQHELIAADSGQGILVTHVLAQAQRHFSQQQIAHVMAERIVDRLEAVQIDEHQRKTAALRLHRRHCLLDAISQQHAIGQTGQGVVQGQLGQFTVGFGE
ncbi:hypothetical protein D3C73_1466850 [compost metagenome]